MCYSLWYNVPTMLPASGLSYIEDARCLKVKLGGAMRIKLRLGEFH